MVVRARDVMTERVVSVFPENPIEIAEALILERGFSALPVVNEYNYLVGIVSVVDILRTRRGAVQTAVGSDVGSAPPRTVGAVMSEDVISMTPDANIGILAHRLRVNGELRVMPIADRGFLVGVVTRSDLLRRPPGGGPLGRAIARWSRKLSAPAPPTVDQPREVGDPVERTSRVPVPLEVRDVMTSKDLVTLSETTAVEEAVRTLVEHRFSALPVVTGGKLIGLVSEADLMRDPLAGRRARRTVTVGGLMTTDVVTSSPDAPIDELYRLLVDEGLRLVPVVSAGLLVGVATRGDLLRLPTPR